MKRVLALASIILLCGCSWIEKPNVEYVKADRLFHDLVAQRAKTTWIPNDSTLTADEIGLLIDAVDNWTLMVEKAERALGLRDE